MPLRRVCNDSVYALWNSFSSTLLKEVGGPFGAAGYLGFAWSTHRLHRDKLYEDAARQGHPGWLNPPLAFFSELPERFGLTFKPLGLLEREVILDRLAAAGFNRNAPPGLGAASDRLLSELLPEGISADQLAQALEKLPSDSFGQARNDALISLYREYQAALQSLGRYDFRAVHAQLAQAISQGKLPAAIGGAKRLHIYGLTSTHTRGALFRALAEQSEVDVQVYLLDDEATRAEWESVLSLQGGFILDDRRVNPDHNPYEHPLPVVRVRPAPDEHRELEFVSLEVKRLILERGITPDRIAVVARTGRTDARLAHEALERAGIPVTARLRWRLDEIPAIKAVSLLLRGAALGWPYRPLRHLLESSYFDLPADLKKLDKIATERRVTGLENWSKALPHIPSLKTLAKQAQRLDAARPAGEWISLTRELLDPGWFEFRKRICKVPSDRFDLVRLDQQGIITLESLLADWASVEQDPSPITPAEWYARWRRFLAGNELALSTPMRTGVQVLEAHEAALVPFDHVFLIHANDGEFPKAWNPGGLFTEPEREALAAAGLPIATRETALRRERALWRAVTSGPATTVTYRTADAAGVPLLPSLLVPPHDRETEIPRVRFIWEDPFTPAHADRAAMQTFAISRRGAGGSVRVPRPTILARALIASYAESRRHPTADGARPGGRPGPWNGLIRHPQVLDHLNSTFGPDYLWSPSQLEGYAQNPFLFLLQRILKIEEVEEAEEDVTVMAVGSLGHSLLEAFHRKYQGNLPAELTSDVETVLASLAGEVFRDAEAKEPWLGVPALWRVRQRQILKNVREYLGWELSKMGTWVPAHFEFAFGKDGQVIIEHADLSGLPAKFRLQGKIDRVDVRKGVHRVVDYKTSGTPTPAQYKDGAALQGALYLAALEACGLPPGEAEYRSIRNKSTGGKVVWGTPVTRTALSIALSIPARVRAGYFEPSAAGSCGWKNYWPGGVALYRILCALDKDGFRFNEY